MKKLLLTGALIVALASFASLAFAGDYHMGDTLICSDCHIMHYSAQHGYDGGAAPTLGAGGPFKGLLKADPNDLCLQCHDGQAGIPDVFGANTNSSVRQAGAINKLTGNDANYDTWKGHTLGSTDVAPGGTFSDSAGLECIDCHMQHGRPAGTDVAGNAVSNPYRNVKAMGTLGVSYARGTNDPTKDVFEVDFTKGSNAHYDVSNISFNEPVSTRSGYAEWCKGCHTNFHGAIGDATTIGGDITTNQEFLRHPAAGVNIGGQSSHGHSSMTSWNANTNHVPVLTSTNATGGTDLTPSCMSCHKAHGNQNAFGLITMAATGTVTEQGVDGAAPKALCKQCHAQG